MEVRATRWNRRLNGSVKIKRISQANRSATKADHLIKSKSVATWQPPYQVACQLPEGFVLEFECWLGKDSIRRFFPTKGVDAFVLEASLAGHAILADRAKEGNPPISHHELRLFNQFSRCTREYLGATLKLGRLLNISRSGRPDAARKDILPEDIGQDSKASGERWSPAQFKGHGLDAAKAAGVAAPTPGEIEWFGLYAAAQKNPLHATDAEAEDLFRLAFDTLGPEVATVDPAAVDYVAEQVRSSLKDHIHWCCSAIGLQFSSRQSWTFGTIPAAARQWESCDD